MKLLIGGDFATTYRGEKAVLEKAVFSEGIIRLLKDADISIVNLESPVANVNDSKIKKIGPHLHTINETIPYLKECGFNVVTLANNHFFDYGCIGVNNTIESLISNKIEFVGGGRNKEEYIKILYKFISVKCSAILKYCE